MPPRQHAVSLLLLLLAISIAGVAGFFHPPTPPAGSKLIRLPSSSPSPATAKPLPKSSASSVLPPALQQLEGAGKQSTTGPLFSDFTPVRWGEGLDFEATSPGLDTIPISQVDRPPKLCKASDSQ